MGAVVESHSSRLCVLSTLATTGMPNLPVLKEHLLKEGRLTQEAALELIHRASAIIKAEPNMLELKYPITGASRSAGACRNGASHSN